MNKDKYKELLEGNGYINLLNVLDFLKDNCIADYEAISDIFSGGMSNDDYYNLQEAIREIEEEKENAED